MNQEITCMYCNGFTISEIWDALDGMMHYKEIENVLWEACLL